MQLFVLHALPNKELLLPYNVNWLVFKIEMQRVYCAAETGSSNKTEYRWSFQLLTVSNHTKHISTIVCQTAKYLHATVSTVHTVRLLVDLKLLKEFISKVWTIPIRLIWLALTSHLSHIAWSLASTSDETHRESQSLCSLCRLTFLWQHAVHTRAFVSLRTCGRNGGSCRYST